MPVVSDTVLLALIATITPTMTAIAAIIIALRTDKKLQVGNARKEGAENARNQKRRKSDRQLPSESPAPRGPGRDL